MGKEIVITEDDAANVAAMILNRSEPTSDDQIYIIEDTLMNEYRIDLADFSALLKALMPFMVQSWGPLTNKRYIGLGKDGVFAVKKEVESIG